jgi:hypothetical protein
MGSSSSAIVYFFVIVYIIIIYFTERRNSTEKYDPKKYIGTSILMIILIIGVELIYGYVTYNPSKFNLFFGVIFTWFIIFTPSFFIYYINPEYSLILNSVFENVIGYLFISSKSNDILSQLNVTNVEETKETSNIKNIVLQINKAQSLFINQLNICNFDELWENLFQPIFQKSNVQNIDESKKTLQMLVREKYIIGKCIWFFYTCIICVTMSTFFMIY